MNIPRLHLGTSAPLRSGAILALIGLFSLILTACGGAGEDSNKTASAPTEEGRAQALSVPGTWTGRAPKYEVINGITVPPEPAPTLNNSTLAGVDINKNGVRDDVERLIARRASNQVGATVAIAYAMNYEKLYKEDWESKTRDQALGVQKLLLCLDILSADRSLYSTSSGSIHSAEMNTQQRRERMAIYTSKLGAFSSTEVRCD